MKSRNQNREKTRKPLGPLLANLTQQYVDKRWPNPKRYFPFWSHLQKNVQNQVPQRKLKKLRMGPNVKYLLRLSHLYEFHSKNISFITINQTFIWKELNKKNIILSRQFLL